MFFINLRDTEKWFRSVKSHSFLVRPFRCLEEVGFLKNFSMKKGPLTVSICRAGILDIPVHNPQPMMNAKLSKQRF